MSNPPPQFLTEIVLQEGATYGVRLGWVNPVSYDKIIVRWDPITAINPTPGSFEPGGDAETYTINGFLPGTTWALKVEGDSSGFVETIVTFPDYSQLLLYRQGTGVVFTAPILGGASMGATRNLGTWQPNWTQLAGYGFGGQRYLLRYMQADGSVWTSELTSIGDGSGLSTVGEPQPAHNWLNGTLTWETYWTHAMAIAPIISGNPFVLLYSPPDNSTQGGGRNFFQSAPFLKPTQIDRLSVVTLGKGVEDQDWSQIVPFVSGGDQYLLFYNHATGNTYTAPIISPTQIGDLTFIGNWDTDWALITSFVFAGSPFLLLYKRNGDAWTSAISSGTHVVTPNSIGGWEGDWALVLPFN